MAQAKLTVGNVEILELSDQESDFPVPLTQLWAGSTADDWKLFVEQYPSAFADAERVHFHYGSFLVRSSGKTLLVDAGTGLAGIPELGVGPGNLMTEMREMGLGLDEIDTVFLTHAHPDHVAWNLTTDGKPTFPKARYTLSQIDWDSFHTPQTQALFPFSYVPETLSPLEGLGVLDLISGDTPITPEITALPAPGHTPGLMMLLISSGGEKALILGDVLHNPAQITNPHWKFMFDMDQDQAVATRTAMLERVEAEGMIIAQCHLPKPGWGRVVRLEGRRVFQGL